MASQLSIQDQLLKASLLCGMAPEKGAAYRLQLFFVANTLLKSKSKQSDFQRALETGVDQSRYWDNLKEKGSGHYILTQSGFIAANKQFGNITPVYPPTEKNKYHILIKGVIQKVPFRMETLGQLTTIHLDDKKIRSAKKTCEILTQSYGVNLQTTGESAVRVLYNYAVENAFSMEWKGEILTENVTTISKESTGNNTVEEASRQNILLNRIIRDTTLTRKVKDLHQNKCQICGKVIQLQEDRLYSEAHHVKPLGNPHNGPDIIENILVVCPNHHVMLDYGAIELKINEIKKVEGHNVVKEYIQYHNKEIYNKNS